MSIFKTEYDTLGDDTYQLNRSNSGNYIDKRSFKNPSQRPQSYNDVNLYAQNPRQGGEHGRRNSLVKLNDFRKKVHEVIDLCKGQNNDVKGELNQVYSQQRNIYDALMENPSVLRRTISQQSFPPNAQNMKQTVPFGQSQSYAPQVPPNQYQRPDVTTPFRQPKQQHVPQSQYYIPNFSQVGVKENNFLPNISQSNLMRPESGYFQQDSYHAPFQNLDGGIDQSAQNFHTSFYKLKNGKQINLSDDALKIIDDIQRKAFEEIQRLRNEKLQIMQRLNQQIKNVNQEKRKNVEMQHILARYNLQGQRPDGSSAGFGAGQNTEYLRAQITRLQQQLQRANDLNNSLRMELSSRGSGIPGIEELLRQGEAIRQQTLRLLKLKEQGDGNQRIQQLERRLAAEQGQKDAALNELRILRQKLGQSRPVEHSGVIDKSSARVRAPFQGKSVGQYEDLVSQMKRITGF